MNDNNNDLAKSMEETLEYGNLEFIGNLGEIAIDAVLDEGLLKDVPVIGSLVGLSKTIRNVYDYMFAKKLIAFLFRVKECDRKERAKAIQKWSKDSKYRIHVGETLIGMIQRCDDTIKAKWLSMLFYEMVLKRDESRLFMRAEKIISSLSVMDVQEFIDMHPEKAFSLRESDCEPYVGSGLYKNAEVDTPVDGTVDLTNRVCKVTEAGYWIYNVLNGREITAYILEELF